MMEKQQISNLLLVLGIVMLAGVGLMELTGSASNPLLPAFSAFFIGCTAVLDRVGIGELD